jgi:hypothetical protein
LYACTNHLPVSSQSRLFKVVSFITGFKNSMKGVGYFLGAASLMLHYYFALGILMLFILAAMPWAIMGLSNQLGRYGRRWLCEAVVLGVQYT